MKRILIGIVLTCIAATGVSQETKTKEKQASFRKQLSASTKAQINQLKDGVLLVKLMTRSNAISALREKGNNALADEIEKKQAEYNLNIVQAFKTNFNFCPTYFFYSDYSKQIRENQLDKVIFLNDSLKPDLSIKLNNKKFLVAEFGKVAQDTAKFTSFYSYEKNENNTMESTPHYKGGPYFDYDALIISSEKLLQLRDPFPYFIRTHSSMPSKKTIESTVKKMNIKLKEFYEQKNKK